jgi:flavodoxin I
MKRVGIFFNSVTGGTQDIAEALQREFGGSTDVRNINEVNSLDLRRYDLVILGASTWNIGEMEDWNNFVTLMDPTEMHRVKFALYGLGDQREFPERFVDLLGAIYDRLAAKGARMIGQTEIAGYNFKASAAVVGGHFVGLAIDQDNQPDLTPVRVKKWVAQLRQKSA